MPRHKDQAGGKDVAAASGPALFISAPLNSTRIFMRQRDNVAEREYPLGLMMVDVFYTAIAAGLFIAACAYAWACAKI